MDWATTDLLDIRTTTKPDLEAMTVEELEALVTYVVANSPHFRLVAAAQQIRGRLDEQEREAVREESIDAAYDRLPDEYKYTRPVIAER